MYDRMLFWFQNIKTYNYYIFTYWYTRKCLAWHSFMLLCCLCCKVSSVCHHMHHVVAWWLGVLCSSMSWSSDAGSLPFWSNTVLLMLHMNSFITCLWAVICHFAVGTLHEHAIQFAVGCVAVLALVCPKSPGHQQIHLINHRDIILCFNRLGHSALFSHCCVVWNLLRVSCCCLAPYFVSMRGIFVGRLFQC